MEFKDKNQYSRDIGLKIIEKAKHSGIDCDKRSLDYVADKFSELSGDKPIQDPILTLCVNLALEKIITHQQCLDWTHGYLAGYDYKKYIDK